jgi:hypothetical protein
MDKRPLNDVLMTTAVLLRSGVMGNYHAPFWRAVEGATLSLTLISCCGFKGGKLDLSIREWTCLDCGAVHDRDGNAAVNILIAGGHSEIPNGRGGRHKTSVIEAAARETSTHLENPVQLSIFDILQ